MHSHIYQADALLAQEAEIHTLAGRHALPVLAAFVDGRGLACPLPLLKAKIALRSLSVQQVLYLVANDSNAATDLTAFCQKNALTLEVWQSTAATSDDSTTSDTIFHFIITKNTGV